MNYLAQLEQALRFYDKNLKGSQGYRHPSADPNMVGGGGEIRPGLLWAQDAMSRQSGMERDQQDFFADEPQNVLMDYQRPSMTGAPPMAKRNTNPRFDNYLSRLMGARNGY